MKPAVFFDRDGVLNRDYGYVHTIEKFDWLDGARESVLACNEAGYLVFVATNQSGIGRGFFGEEDMHALHRHMQEDLRAMGAHIDAFAFCPHHPEAALAHLRQVCECRKPAPGMILRLCRDWDVDRAASFLVGDKASDVAAAQAAGIRGHLFAGGNLLDSVLPFLAKFQAKALFE